MGYTLDAGPILTSYGSRRPGRRDRPDAIVGAQFRMTWTRNSAALLLVLLTAACQLAYYFYVSRHESDDVEPAERPKSGSIGVLIEMHLFAILLFARQRDPRAELLRLLTLALMAITFAVIGWVLLGGGRHPISQRLCRAPSRARASPPACPREQGSSFASLMKELVQCPGTFGLVSPAQSARAAD